MPSQNFIFHLLMFAFTLASHGCQQKKVKADQNISSIIKKSETINKPNGVPENPAVIYRSNDTGMTWHAFDNGIPEEATLSDIKQSDNKVYATTDYHGAYVSVDGQNNWTKLSGKILEGTDINCIEIDNKHIVIGTLRQGTFISSDGGLSWNPSKGNIKSPIRAFFKTESTFYAGTDSGIFESADMGNTWTHVFGQMQILGFTSLKNKIYAATQSGAIMSNDDGSKWKSIYTGDALHDIGNDGTSIYAMTIGQQLLKTQNDGESWENAQNGITRPPNFYTNELQHTGNNIFSAQWIGIYHSQNNGNNWKLLSGLPDATAFSTLEITDYGIIAGISIR